MARRIQYEILVNIGFSALNAVGVLLSASVAGQLFTPQALGIVLLGRRLAGAAANLTQLGISQTIQRYISLYASDRRRKASYLCHGAAILTASSLLTVAVIYLSRAPLASTFFPTDPNGADLCMWLAFLIASTASGFFAASLLLAERRMWTAGTLQLLNNCGFFLLALWWEKAGQQPVVVFQYCAIATLASSTLILAAFYVRWNRSTVLSLAIYGPQVRQDFLQYGFPRTFTSFLDASIVLVGPWLSRNEPGQIAAFLLAMTIIRVVQAGFAPISQVIGLGAARMVGRGHHGELSVHTRRLIESIFYAGILFPCMFAPWSGLISSLWLGASPLSAEVAAYLRVLIWATTPLSLFYGLRGVIDMRWTVPLNLLSLIACIAIQIISYHFLRLLLPTPQAIAYAVTTGIWFLGIMTLVWIRRDFPRWNQLRPLSLLACAAAVALINTKLAKNPDVPHLLISLLASSIISLVFCSLYPPDFLAQLAKVMMRARTDQVDSSVPQPHLPHRALAKKAR